MPSGYFLPIAIAMSFATPAFAAGATAPSSTPGSQTQVGNDQGTGQTATPRIAKKLRDNLAQAGFTDIRVMPQSFLVRAKDQDGNPVMMVINPDSMTAVTALGTSGNNKSGSQSNGSGTGAGVHSGGGQKL